MKFSRKVGLAALVFALTLFVGFRHAAAQTQISGAIAGTITDPTGAAIPGAKITITNAGTGVTKTVKSGAAGDFSVGLLQPGQYTLQVAATGFRTAQQSVAVAVGQAATVNISLAIAQGVQTVQVEGTAVPILQTENSNISTTLTQQQVQNLPNPGGDITDYINMTTGVVENTQMGYGNSSAFGLPATSNNFTINGAEDNDPFLNLNNSGPSNLLLGSNDISEVSIVANAYSAQYGALGGVQENVITRSGTNQFHGNATYYWTNSDLNANDWFNDNAGAPEPFANANQWGAAIGGPIKRNRAWFFVNYEGLRFVTSPVSTVFVPGADYESNTASDAGTTTTASNKDGSTYTVYQDISVLGSDGNCDNNSSSLYMNGQGSQCAFYKHMFSLYNATPHRSLATPSGTVGAGYSDCIATASNGDCTEGISFPTGLDWMDQLPGGTKNDLTEVLTTARMDLKLGPNDTAFLHFSRDNGLQPTSVDPIDPTAFNSDSQQPDYQGQMEETHTFSPNLVNQFVLSGAWYSAIFVNANPSLSLSTMPYTLEFAASYSNLGGSDFVFPQGRNVTQVQLNDDVSWIHGRHTISFGFLGKRDDVTDADLGILTEPLGVALGPGYNGPFDGDDLFSQGALYEGLQRFPQRLEEPIATLNLGAYVQDQWKPTSNLELTGGIRLEHNENPTCGTSCFARLAGNYNTISDTLDTPYNQVISSGLTNTFNGYQALAVLPRVGFTYSLPNHRTTLFRGGFGMFTDVFPATIADDLLDNAPLNVQFTYYFGLTDPSQPGSELSELKAANAAYQPAFGAGENYNQISAADPSFAAPGVDNVDKDLHYPIYEEWSFQVQQQIGHHDGISLGYVGNHGYHEPVQNNGVNLAADQLPAPGSLNPSLNLSLGPCGQYFCGLPATTPLPEFDGVTEVQSAAVSNYDGLLVSVQHQAKFATAMLNYTWSHALDEMSNGGILPFGSNSISPIDPFDLSRNYGNADYDIRQNMNANYIVTVPYFGGPKFLTDRWQLGGTLFFHSGFPFSVTTGNDTDSVLNNGGNYGGSMLADIANPSVLGTHCGKSAVSGLPGGTPCLSASDFAHPTSFDDPNAQMRNQFRGPGWFDTDFNLMKGFRIPGTEAGQVQIGAVAYNVLNHINFLDPSGDMDASTFGQIYAPAAGVPTSVFGAFLGGDSSPRILQLKANIQF
jgi:hypothetical protein